MAQKDSFKNAFADVVKKHRIKAKLSQHGLAEKAGLHQTYIGLLESKKRSPSMYAANKLASAFGIPLSKLVLEVEKRIPKEENSSTKTAKARH